MEPQTLTQKLLGRAAEMCWPPRRWRRRCGFLETSNPPSSNWAEFQDVLAAKAKARAGAASSHMLLSRYKRPLSTVALLLAAAQTRSGQVFCQQTQTAHQACLLCEYICHLTAALHRILQFWQHIPWVGAAQVCSRTAIVLTSQQAHRLQDGRFEEAALLRSRQVELVEALTAAVDARPCLPRVLTCFQFSSLYPGWQRQKLRSSS